MEYNNTGELKNKLAAYLKAHPEIFQRSESRERQSDTQNYNPDVDTFRNTKDRSNFRHKDDGNVLLQQFDRANKKRPEQVRKIIQSGEYINLDSMGEI